MLLFDLEVDVLNNDDTGIAVSAWRRFSLGTCSNLEPKEQIDAPLGGGQLRVELYGSVQ